MTPARWLAGATLSLVLTGAAAAQGPDVGELRFEGNEAFSRAELTAAIVTQAPTCGVPVLCIVGIGWEYSPLDPSVLEADVFRLRVYYFERGYREAEVRADTTGLDTDRVRVTFRIREGRPVRTEAVEIEGLPAAVSRRSLPLRVGQPFDVVAYEATRDTLQSRLWNGGYAHAQVLVGYTIDRAQQYRARVRYTVYPGAMARFGEIEVTGTDETSPDLVDRMLTFDEGGRYDRRALLQSQRNLYGLQVFRFADVAARTETGDSVIPVRVQVAEGNMHRVRLGGGINNVECANLEGEWTSRNFLGDGRRLTVGGRVGNLLIDNCGWLVTDEYASYTKLTGVASVDFTQPWFFGPRNSIAVGLFAERRNVPDVFVRSALGGYLSFTRSLGRSSALTLAFRPELTDLVTENELFFCVSFVACTFEAIDDLQEPHWLSPVTLSFTMDRTDALFSPSEGFIVRLDLEHAASYTGSDFAYTRLLGESSQYIGEAGGVVLATRVRGGVGIPHPGGTSSSLGLNPQKRFFAGGANSVRGFDQFRLGPTLLGIDAVPDLVEGDDPETEGTLDGAGCTLTEVNSGTCNAGVLPGRRFDRRPTGGEVLLEGNVELRFPLPVAGGSLRGAVFVDAGQVWATRSDFDPGEIVATPGFGLRYQSPIGPIRLDVALNTLGSQQLTVLTTGVETCLVDEPGCYRVQHRTPHATLRNTENVVALDESVSYGAGLAQVRTVGDFLNQIQIHFSIGEAF
jgi:outer membrane protein assembly complex protein YaeT